MLILRLKAGFPELRTEAEVLGAMAALDARTWVFKVERPRNAGGDEVETGVTLAGTLVKALSIAEGGGRGCGQSVRSGVFATGDCSAGVGAREPSCLVLNPAYVWPHS